VFWCSQWLWAFGEETWGIYFKCPNPQMKMFCQLWNHSHWRSSFPCSPFITNTLHRFIMWIVVNSDHPVERRIPIPFWSFKSNSESCLLTTKTSSLLCQVHIHHLSFNNIRFVWDRIRIWHWREMVRANELMLLQHNWEASSQSTRSSAEHTV
jgi:hypothetical protein